MEIKSNPKERLFVISFGEGYSCLPFDVVYAQATEIVRRLQHAAENSANPKAVTLAEKTPQLLESQIGTLEQYEQYKTLLSLFAELGDISTWFDARTPVAVQKALEKARKTRGTVRLFYGDTKTGRSWLSEDYVVGRIGRSGGLMKSPLLMVDAIGGSAILTDSLVRIVDLKTDRDLYRHPKFYVPKMNLAEAADYDKPLGYTHRVNVENADTGAMETLANFKSIGEAARWIAFMSGDVYNDAPARLAA